MKIAFWKKTPWYRNPSLTSGFKYGVGVAAGLLAVDIATELVGAVASRVSDRLAARRANALGTSPQPEAPRAQA